MAAQVGEIDKADRRDLVRFNPLEYRAEVRTSTALGLQIDRL